jgi:hypothetical protein
MEGGIDFRCVPPRAPTAESSVLVAGKSQAAARAYESLRRARDPSTLPPPPPPCSPVGSLRISNPIRRHHRAGVTVAPVGAGALQRMGFGMRSQKRINPKSQSIDPRKWPDGAWSGSLAAGSSGQRGRRRRRLEPQERAGKEGVTGPKAAASLPAIADRWPVARWRPRPHTPPLSPMAARPAAAAPPPLRTRRRSAPAAATRRRSAPIAARGSARRGGAPPSAALPRRAASCAPPPAAAATASNAAAATAA